MTRKIVLGPSEVRLLFELEKEKRTAFDLDDVMRITGLARADTWQVIHRLSNKKRIARVERGKYVLVPARAGVEGVWSESPFLVLPHIIDPYYVGFWTAMSHWSMTEQIPLTIFVATTKRKRPVKYGGNTFRFISLSKRKFFGFTEEKIANQTFNISTREKTIIDGLVLPQHCGGMSEVAKAIWNSQDKLDWDTLLAMTKRMGVDAAQRRLGYILHMLKIQPKITHSLRKKDWHDLRFLDPKARKKALSYAKEFGLILNVSNAKLMSWRGT